MEGRKQPLPKTIVVNVIYITPPPKSTKHTLYSLYSTFRKADLNILQIFVSQTQDSVSFDGHTILAGLFFYSVFCNIKIPTLHINPTSLHNRESIAMGCRKLFSRSLFLGICLCKRNLCTGLL